MVDNYFLCGKQIILADLLVKLIRVNVGSSGKQLRSFINTMQQYYLYAKHNVFRVDVFFPPQTSVC